MLFSRPPLPDTDLSFRICSFSIPVCSFSMPLPVLAHGTAKCTPHTNKCPFRKDIISYFFDKCNTLFWLRQPCNPLRTKTARSLCRRRTFRAVSIYNTWRLIRGRMARAGKAVIGLVLDSLLDDIGIDTSRLIFPKAEQIPSYVQMLMLLLWVLSGGSLSCVDIFVHKSAPLHKNPP